MDIRSFFGVKKKKSVSKESNEKEKDENNEEKKQVSHRSNKAGSSSHSRQKKRKGNDNATLKVDKRQKQILESDSDHTSLNDDNEKKEKEINVVMMKKEESTQRNQSIKAKTKKEEKSNDLRGNKDNKKIEISAEDFFASQDHKKEKSNVKKLEKNLNNNNEENDDETVSNDEINFEKYTSKSKITIEDSEEEWNQADEEEEEDENDILDEDDNFIVRKIRKESKRESSSIQTSPKLSKQKSSSPTKTISKKNIKPISQKPKKILIRPKPPYPKPFTTDDVPSECLTNIKFVLTGIQPNLPRDEMEDFIKILGGRVTKAVSGQTNYLICGKELEDGRDVTEGSKYKKAKELGEDKITILHGEDEFYGVIKTICSSFYNKSNECDQNADVIKDDSNIVKMEKQNSNEQERKGHTSPIKISAESNSKNTIFNPYAKRKSSRINTKSLQTDNKSKTTIKNRSRHGKGSLDVEYALWADKYSPSSTKDILGNGENVRKLTACKH